MAKPTSVGLILTNGNVFLAVSPTGAASWDIPKGMQQPNEARIDTIIREMEEETGVDIYKYRAQLQPIGLFTFTAEKNLFVYVLKLDKLPPVSSMVCRSMYHPTPDIERPEVDLYRYLPLTHTSGFRPQLIQIIQHIVNKIKNGE